jgi:hypothetical protein
MRLHLVLLALALGCATEDSKTDDTSGSGSGEESEDMGNLLTQVVDMATEMAELSATIAAQQAVIVQLEMEMAETLRWEVFEHTCVADDYAESTGVTADGAVIALAYAQGSRGWTKTSASPDFYDGEVTLDCAPDYLRLVTVGYER